MQTIGVHDPHETSEIGRGLRVKSVEEVGRHGRKFRDHIGNSFGRILAACRFNDLNALQNPIFWPSQCLS